ncbi:hypothetical protein BDW62DRAFT_81849 [Aspergillus aurantiobrunneus]
MTSLLWEPYHTRSVSVIECTLTSPVGRFANCCVRRSFPKLQSVIENCWFSKYQSADGVNCDLQCIPSHSDPIEGAPSACPAGFLRQARKGQDLHT